MKSKSILMRLSSVSALCILILGFASCKKDQAADSTSPGEIELAAQVSQDQMRTAGEFEDVFNVTQSLNSYSTGEEEMTLGTESAIAQMPEGGENHSVASHCFTVTVVPKMKNQWPKTIEIDFGDGCTGKDGKVRKGKIVSIYTKPAFLPGAVVSTTFLGYQVDSFAMSGTHKMTNASTPQRVRFEVQVINGKVTNVNSGFWRKHESNREYTQLDGWNMPAKPFKGGYKITGVSRGSNSNGHSWRTEIETPLVRRFDCPWISKGVKKIWWNNRTQPATLDYGDGSCDDQALLTWKDKTKVITLK